MWGALLHHLKRSRFCGLVRRLITFSLTPVPSINSSPLKNFRFLVNVETFLDSVRLDEFFDHTGFLFEQNSRVREGSSLSLFRERLVN